MDASPTYDALRRAVASGEVVRIIYNAGSQPGSIREVQPITITADEMHAFDVATGIEKTFMLSKVKLPTAGEKTRLYEPNLAIGFADSQTVQRALTPKVAELAAMGWHVELGSNAISLHGYFKNGKPRKSPDVSLDYAPYVTDQLDYDWNADKLVEVSRKVARPYSMRSVGSASVRSFQHLTSAAIAFLREAAEHAPKKGT